MLYAEFRTDVLTIPHSLSGHILRQPLWHGESPRTAQKEKGETAQRDVDSHPGSCHR